MSSEIWAERGRLGLAAFQSTALGGTLAWYATAWKSLLKLYLCLECLYTMTTAL